MINIPLIENFPSLPTKNIGHNLANDWDYQTAFSRHPGLLTYDEQHLLRNRRVAIAGMGGVGGIHLITLSRLGIGKFTIAIPIRSNWRT